MKISWFSRDIPWQEPYEISWSNYVFRPQELRKNLPNFHSLTPKV